MFITYPRATVGIIDCAVGLAALKVIRKDFGSEFSPSHSMVPILMLHLQCFRGKSCYGGPVVSSPVLRMVFFLLPSEREI